MRLMLGTIGVVGILVTLLLVRMKPREAPQPDGEQPTVAVAAATEPAPQPAESPESWGNEDGEVGSVALPEFLPQPRIVRSWQEAFFHDPSGDFRAADNDGDVYWVLNSPGAKRVLNRLDFVREVKFRLNDEVHERRKAVPIEQVEKDVAAMRQHPELASLPWRKGKDCTIDKAEAEKVGKLSRDVRAALSGMDARLLRDTDPVPGLVGAWGRVRERIALFRDEPGYARLIAQVLQPEHALYRMLLVELLDDARGAEAAEALARLAVFDPDERVRYRAIERLWSKPRDQYRRELVDALHHVWPAASRNAAEALIQLRSYDAVPDLAGLLDLPDPAAPFVSPESGQPVVRELVRLNHNHSCVLCHAPAERKDVTQLRGAVFNTPSPEEQLREFPNLQYSGSSSLLVRIDKTSLRQDFSAKVACYDNGKWPERQRYDFFTRLRPATPAELADAGKRAGRDSPQRQHVLRALRELTGKDGGDDAGAWKKIAREMPPDGRW
jgi:hypothetical protein